MVLAIYDVLGQKVRVLVEDFVEAGYRSVVWDGRDDIGRDVASGVYLCWMVADHYQAVRSWP